MRFRLQRAAYAVQVKLPRSLACLQLSLLLLPSLGHAITVRISAGALERTLRKQLFNGLQDRYFLRGHGEPGCYISAQDPRVSFRDDRVVVHVKTRARLGTSVRGSCVGVGLSVEADVTLLPEAEGETIGFRDPHLDLSDSHQLNVFLEPFLSRKLPHEMRLNAGDVLRHALGTSTQTTSYDVTLATPTIRSMQVSGDTLVLDVDGEIAIR